MKIAKISHIRCDEWSDTTFVWVPDEWSEQDFKDAVNRARAAYLAVFDAYDGKDAPGGHETYFPMHPEYRKYPDLTVAEIDRRHAALKAEWNAWKKEQDAAKRTFEKYLVDEGMIAFYDHYDLKTNINWGHNHGKHYQYGMENPNKDDLPGPVKVDRVDY